MFAHGRVRARQLSSVAAVVVRCGGGWVGGVVCVFLGGGGYAPASSGLELILENIGRWNFSSTRKPTMASCAMRPCLSSAAAKGAGVGGVVCGMVGWGSGGGGLQIGWASYDGAAAAAAARRELRG